ncbi:MAG: hypothetical protein KIT22_00020 [Verrucomicrobiae bacterium]|nr:hypothetical protein [Verrucomicrobiae bacterium]
MRLEIEKIGPPRWNAAYRCTSRDAELIVETGIGPRILSLKWAGSPNLLYEDDTQFGVGAWRLYGGHRFATAPESKLSYFPDNRPCRVTADSQRLRIEQVRMPMGLRKTLTIEPSPEADGFVLHHDLDHAGSAPWSGAIWTILCVPAIGCVRIPTRPVAGLDSDEVCHFWNCPGWYTANPASRQWRQEEGLFSVLPRGETAKVGIYSPDGRLDFEHPAAGLTLLQTEIPPRESCPHQGCNIEVFTAPRYLELEMLGKVTTLQPGDSMRLTQHWLLSPPIPGRPALSIPSPGFSRLRVVRDLPPNDLTDVFVVSPATA